MKSSKILLFVEGEIIESQIIDSLKKYFLNKMLFMLPDNYEKLAITGVRFDNDKLISTNTYSMVIQDYESNLQFTLTKKTCQALSKAFDDSEVYITKVMYYIIKNLKE